MNSLKICFITTQRDLLKDESGLKNTTQHLMQECMRREHNVYSSDLENLYLEDNVAKTSAFKLSEDNYYIEKNLVLNDFGVLLIREAPPFNLNYLYATYILDYVNTEYTLIINSSSGLRKANEKLYVNKFPQVAPKSIVTSNIDLIRNFIEQNSEVILKPLNDYGGNGIFKLSKEDKNINSIIEMSTEKGKTSVIVQKFINDENGDKRIVLINGEPQYAISRIKSNFDFRNNMSKGARTKLVSLTQKDIEICSYLRPKLLVDGLIFVGLDVIQDKVIEINVTSPGFFIQNINRETNQQFEAEIVKFIEQQAVSRVRKRNEL